jgi:hypothetical protein
MIVVQNEKMILAANDPGLLFGIQVEPMRSNT